MKTVYKYPLEPNYNGKPTGIVLPLGATVLRIAEQGKGKVMLWVLIDPEEEDQEVRLWHVIGTGENTEHLPEVSNYGTQKGFAHQETVLCLGGTLVLHYWVSHPQ